MHCISIFGNVSFRISHPIHFSWNSLTSFQQTWLLSDVASPMTGVKEKAISSFRVCQVTRWTTWVTTSSRSGRSSSSFLRSRRVMKFQRRRRRRAWKAYYLWHIRQLWSMIIINENEVRINCNRNQWTWSESTPFMPLMKSWCSFMSGSSSFMGEKHAHGMNIMCREIEQTDRLVSRHL